jgi:hypothetical protein
MGKRNLFGGEIKTGSPGKSMGSSPVTGNPGRELIRANNPRQFDEGPTQLKGKLPTPTGTAWDAAAGAPAGHREGGVAISNMADSRAARMSPDGKESADSSGITFPNFARERK